MILDTYEGPYGVGGAVRTFQAPQGFNPILTMSWTFDGGPCDGADVVARWASVTRVDGVYNAGWQMKPWTSTPIFVRSFQLVKLSGGPHTNMMIGNSYVNDEMVSVGANETVGFAGAPDAAGIPFPGTSNDPGDAYFDLHGYGTGGGTMSWRVMIAYTPLPIIVGTAPPPPPPPPPPPTGGQTLGSTPGSAATAGFVGATWVDRAYTVTANTTVTALGLYSASACAGTLKLMQRTSAGQYDVLGQVAFTHSGGGWADFNLSSSIAVGSIEAHVGVYVTSGTINYSSQARSWKNGEVTGTGNAMTEDTNAILATRVTF